MKVLLDCIVTAADPRKCSTNIQFLTFVNRTLETRSDVFFYWLVPDWFDDEQMAEYYPQDDRIRYIRVPQHKDRTKEYLTLSKALDEAVAFNGSLWDFDAILTVRAGLSQLLRMLANSPRTYKHSWVKPLWVLEAMVLMEFKETVLCFAEDVQDQFTLSGYLSADKVFVTSQIDRQPILQRARELLPPSRVRQLEQKIVAVGYGQFSELTQKTPDQFPDPANGKPLCIAHAGRMEKANRIEEINAVMTKQFVMKGDQVKLLVCTVSSGPKVFDTSIIDCKTASREEFWELCKTEMHVIIKLSNEGTSSLALLEPMMMGVPAILGPRWAVDAALGKGYPFIADNESQAYAFAQMFFDDYAKQYAVYAKWQKEVLDPLMRERMGELSIYKQLDNCLEEFDTDNRERFRKVKAGKKNNAFIKDLLAHVGDAEEFVLTDVVTSMAAAGKADKKMVEKLTPGDRDVRGLVWSSDFNEVRRVLIDLFGWRDASTTVGHFRRGK